MTSLLVVSPHPDDETLGAGGLILKTKQMGFPTYWLNITNMSLSYGWEQDRIDQRKTEIEKVISSYQVDKYLSLDLEPVGLDKYPRSEIVLKISTVFNQLKPEMIVIPWKSDPHSDHNVVYESVISASKSFRYPFIKKILAMEILSETNFSDFDDFSPNYFVDITGFLDKKIQIMNIYKSEMGNHPFPRSDEALRSLAVLRGSQAGVVHAEAFRVIKIIDKQNQKI
ncbi:MAG: PIG-L deacetylase family protein [Leptospira sp.]|nr:PIG-L deacetylase family protein [Leptospira sp.]